MHSKPSRIRQLAATIGLGSGMAVALAAPLMLAPDAAAGPGFLSSPNCMMGSAQVSYCDTDVSADGSWVRCSRPIPGDISILGGTSTYAPLGAGSCERVTATSVPVGSPPYHIGYGGEAFGRV